MGNCFSYTPSLDDLIRSFSFLSSNSYFPNLKENFEDLEKEIEDLKALQDGVKNKVAIEERQLRQQSTEGVNVWLKRVEETEREFRNLQRDSSIQLDKLCLCGLWSENVCESYVYGKSVFLLLEEVKKLKLNGKFEEVTEKTLTSKVVKRPTGPTIGHETMLDKAWKRLMEKEVGIMGLHGMGGVGKTTLFKKIHNKFAEMADEFDVVIWIVVSKGAKISKLQEEIAKKLYICDEVWMIKNEGDKAAEINNILEEKKFVLMFDDIWEEMHLETIGIPFPTIENGCKVAFTTRSLEVCKQMGAHEAMQVNCLEPEEAWKFFKDMTANNISLSNPVIVELARKVAEKCRGLPLALNVIGKAMVSTTTVQEWEFAVDDLTKSAGEYFDIDKKILSILKYSYDSLRDEHIKSCFLYCALFPEDCWIEKENLAYYWICEGLIGEEGVIKRAKNKGHYILGTLMRANLLMEESSDTVVMHDVVREMALWIASDLGKQKETFVVQANVGLREIPKVKDWGAVRKISFIQNNIEEIICDSDCSELTTLFLQDNNLKNLSGKFIESMQKLVVLDLADNSEFNKLPEEISELASLQYLDLSYTSIEKLVLDGKKFPKLSHLNLIGTSRLCSLGGVSNLSSLRILNLKFSSVHGDVNLVKELQRLKHLQVLTITISTELALEKILCDQRLSNCIHDIEICDFQQKPLNILLLVSLENLSDLFVGNSHISEIATDMKSKESRTNLPSSQNPTSPCFTNLSKLFIRYCQSLKDLTWILFAPNLAIVSISDCGEVEEIINKDRATKLTGIKPFEKLISLHLSFLPKLESIYWKPLHFPLLCHIRANHCPNLRKLPFEVTSVPRLDRFTRGFTVNMVPLTNKAKLEWEDKDTEDRFKDLFY